MAGRLPRLPGVVATVDTAGLGVLIPSGGLQDPWLIGTASVASTDRVELSRFILPVRIVVRRIVFEITTLDSGKVAAAGIYNADGTTLLIDSGAISTTGTGIKSTALSTAVTLEPGVYILAGTSDSTTVAYRAQSYLNSSDLYRKFVNTNNVQLGRATNSSSSAVFPATLGTLLTVNIKPMLIGLET